MRMERAAPRKLRQGQISLCENPHGVERGAVHLVEDDFDLVSRLRRKGARGGCAFGRDSLTERAMGNPRAWSIVGMRERRADAGMHPLLEPVQRPVRLWR